MVGLRPDGAKGAAGGDGDRAEPSGREEPRVRGPRREHTVCFGDRKRAGLEPAQSGEGRQAQVTQPAAWGGDILPAVGTPWKLLSGRAA